MKKKFNVLIIDDAFFIRGLIKKAIGAKKNDDCVFEVLAEATNGKEGLDLYKMSCPDVVTVDINMPKLNGLELITEIKKINPNAQIIVISSNIDSKLQQNISKMGVHFLHKPFIENDIWNKLDLISESMKDNLEDKTINNKDSETSQKEVLIEQKIEQKNEIKVEEVAIPTVEKKVNQIVNKEKEDNNTLAEIKTVEPIIVEEKKDDKVEISESSDEKNNNEVPKKKKKKKKKKNLDSDSILEVGAIPSDIFSQYVDSKKTKQENNQPKNIPVPESKKTNNKIDSFITNDTISIPVVPKVDNKTNDKNFNKQNPKKETEFTKPIEDKFISTGDNAVKIHSPEKQSSINKKNTAKISGSNSGIKDESKKIEPIKTQNFDEILLVEDNLPKLVDNENPVLNNDSKQSTDEIISIKDEDTNVPNLDEILIIDDEPVSKSNDEIVSIKDEPTNIPNFDEILLVEDKKPQVTEDEFLIIDDDSKQSTDEIISIKDGDTNVPNLDEILIIDDEPVNKSNDEIVSIKDEPTNIPNFDEILLVEDKKPQVTEDELLIIDDESKQSTDEIISIKDEPTNVPNLDEILIIDDEPVSKSDDEIVSIKDESTNIPNFDEILLVEDSSSENKSTKSSISLNIDKKEVVDNDAQNNEELSDIEAELLAGISYNIENELDLTTEEETDNEDIDIDRIFKDDEISEINIEPEEPIVTEEDLRKQKLDELDMILENMDAFDFDKDILPDNKFDKSNNNEFVAHSLNKLSDNNLMAKTSVNKPVHEYHTHDNAGSASKMELNYGVHNYNTTNSAKTVIAPPKSSQLTQIHSEKLKQNYGLIVLPEKEEVEEKKSGGFFAKLFNLFKKKKK